MATKTTTTRRPRPERAADEEKEMTSAADNGSDNEVRETASAAPAKTDGKPDDALQTVRKAVEYDPSSYQAQFQLGVVLTALNNYDDAVAAHKSALQLNRRETFPKR